MKCDIIIPAAGVGNRFWPYTKTIAKELLPFITKPAIQYALEECIQISDRCIVVAHKSKTSLIDYLEGVRIYEPLFKTFRPDIVYQESAKGLGHAILCAEPLINDSYFGVMLPDDIIISNRPALDQLLDIALSQKATVIAVQEVSQSMVSAYGIIQVKQQISDTIFHVSSLVEKPSPARAPSRLAIVGRYIISSKIFPLLNQARPSVVQEIQLTDALQELLAQGEPVIAVKVEG
ncbi:MAG TPA: sugar phosphate nucleotidyltransferase, partial [Candidatus Babeliaceae bacterium]|nr:sugar phosphate nucleotidyltransferase [Candidatus Babeliaceae bacterium]